MTNESKLGRKHVCSVSDVPMVDGQVLDVGHMNMPHEPHWREGKLERGLLSGLKLEGRRLMAARTYRCPRCFRLESFAY